MTKTFAEPGIVRSGWTCTRPARSSGTPSAAPSGDADTPAAQSTVSEAIVSTPIVDESRRHAGHDRVGPHVDAKPLQIVQRGRAQVFREGAQDRRPAFEQQDPRRARIEMPEVAGERVPRDLRERARHLDAGRSAADDDEGQQRGRFCRIALPLGALEREQHPPPDLERVLERLEPGRDAPPLVVAEVRVRRAGRDDQEVVVDHAVGQEQAIARAGRRRGLARGGLRRSAAGAGSSGSARRCRPARAPPSPPDTAAAETRDGCAGRRA